ncbi:MAG: hypothetical protein HY587_04555 [Candidatus Omnitrophica bacterium]|nr:hypothetical protein [Candidatus Omnitrophota bacterium]
MLDEIRNAIHLRLENLKEDITGRDQTKIQDKTNEFITRGAIWGGSIGVYLEIEMAGVREMAEALLTFYQNELFDAGLGLASPGIVDLLERDLTTFLQEREAETLTHVEQWCKRMGFNTDTHTWVEKVRQKYENLKQRCLRTLHAETQTANLRLKKSAQEAVQAAERIIAIPFIAQEDIERTKSARVRKLLIELNANVKENCPNGAAALIRAVVVASVRWHFIHAGRKEELKRNASDVIGQFAEQIEAPSTVRDAARHLRTNAKILGDLALHSDDIDVTMSDISNCQASLKIVVTWIGTQKATVAIT